MRMVQELSQIVVQSEQKHFRLTDLPQELKLMIADYVLHIQDYIWIARVEAKGHPTTVIAKVNKRQSLKANLALLKVCKAFYRDFRPQFLKQNLFIFEDSAAYDLFSKYFDRPSYRSLRLHPYNPPDPDGLFSKLCGLTKTPDALTLLKMVELHYIVVGVPYYPYGSRLRRLTMVEFGRRLVVTLFQLSTNLKRLRKVRVRAIASYYGEFESMKSASIARIDLTVRTLEELLANHHTRVDLYNRDFVLVSHRCCLVLILSLTPGLGMGLGWSST